MKNLFFTVVATLLFAGFATAQTSAEQDLSQIILEQDSLFWVSYNTCDLEAFPTFLTEDLEFYHDMSGLTETRAELFNSMKNGLCSRGENEIYREAIPGTIEVFPLANYGAIIRGEHTFAEKKDGKVISPPEGKAQFMHLWKQTDEGWQMSRVVSYDHKAFSHD